MATIATLAIRLTADQSGLRAGLEEAGAAAQAFGRRLSDMGRDLTTKVTLPIAGLGAAALKLASDAQEAGDKFVAVFGPGAEQMNVFLRELQVTVPATSKQLQEMSAEIQDLLVPMGVVPSAASAMTKQVVQLAADLASFNNIPMAEALERIRAGLVGQNEPLLKFGVALDAATVKARAVEMGLAASTGAVDAAGRAQAAFSLILERTTAAHGNAADTADSMANSLKFLLADVKQLGITIGSILIPAVQPLVQWLRSVVERFQELSPQTQKAIVVVAGLAAALGPLLVAVGAAAAAIAALASPVGAAIGIIAALGAGVAALTVAWKKHGTDVKGSVTDLFKSIKAHFEKIVATVMAVAEPLVQLTGAWLKMQLEIVGFVTDLAVAVIRKMTELSEGVWHWLVDRLQPIASAVESVFRPVVDFFDRAAATIAGILERLVGTMRTVFVGGLTRIVDGVRTQIERVTEFFADLRETLVGNSIVVDMVTEIGDEFLRMRGDMDTHTGAAKTAVIDAFDTLAGGLPTKISSITGEIGRITSLFGDLSAIELGSWVDDILNFVRTLANALPSLVDTIVDTLAKIGREILVQSGDMTLQLGAPPPGSGGGGVGTTVGGSDAVVMINLLNSIENASLSAVSFLEGIGEKLKLHGQLLFRIARNTQHLVPAGGGAGFAVPLAGPGAAEAVNSIEQLQLSELQRIARHTEGLPRLVESVQTGVEVHHTGDLRVTGDGGGAPFSRSLLERVNEGLGIETERGRLHDGLVF